ncbi:YbaB/EbfC family nucleoid-associated protein [Nocardia sp. NPDC088792]|uniref:YbaB/EbfC family nucleoid-associated protein n=1 Tax=Nocardia sp. NPDC088792 TaxID=3364332 RepID=UPI0037FDFDFA
MTTSSADAALTELMLRAVVIEERVEQIRGRGEAAEGRIRAEVDVRGTLTGLYIADSLAGFAMDELAQWVTRAQSEACTRARAEADEMQRELTESSYAAALFHEAAQAGLREAETKTRAVERGWPGNTAGPHDWQDEWERARWRP